MAENDQFNLAGMAPDTLYQQLTTKGVTSVDAGILVGSWIFHNFGGGQRSFTYGQGFDATDAACAPAFQRSFHHADWVDGESVVQAQSSAGEDGFNTRFHNIEADLDGLSQDTAKLFACMAEMRSALHDRLAELSNELNRLDADVYRIGQGRGGVIEPPRVGGAFGSLVDSPSFLGSSKLGDTPVTLWRSTQGITMLPSVLPIAGDPATDPRVRNTTDFSKFATDNADFVAEYKGKQVSVGDVLSKYGAQVLPSGATVSDALGALPQGATFASVDALTEALSQQAAGALRSQPGVPDVIAASLNTAVGAPLGSASIDLLTSVPAPTRQALADAGLTTIGAVAAADPKVLSKALSAASVTATAGDVSAIATAARTISLIR